MADIDQLFIVRGSLALAEEVNEPTIIISMYVPAAGSGTYTAENDGFVLQVGSDGSAAVTVDGTIYSNLHQGAALIQRFGPVLFKSATANRLPQRTPFKKGTKFTFSVGSSNTEVFLVLTYTA